MCYCYAFQRSHTCTNEIECESVYRTQVWAHVAGHECLLRSLEKRRECPMFRTPRDYDEALWTYNESYEEPEQDVVKDVMR
jgi:hypothetical protein